MGEGASSAIVRNFIVEIFVAWLVTPGDFIKDKLNIFWTFLCIEIFFLLINTHEYIMIYIKSKNTHMLYLY